MNASKEYNGHKNWNHWNVSLWLLNDEGLNSLTLDAAQCTNRRASAAGMLARLHDEGITHTPDGARYTISAIYAVLTTFKDIKWKVYWSPEGRVIAEVEARTARKAIRKAPMPYREYLGEMYAIPTSY